MNAPAWTASCPASAASDLMRVAAKTQNLLWAIRMDSLHLGRLGKYGCVKMKPPEKPQALVLGSVYQGFILGTYF